MESEDRETSPQTASEECTPPAFPAIPIPPAPRTLRESSSVTAHENASANAQLTDNVAYTKRRYGRKNRFPKRPRLRDLMGQRFGVVVVESRATNSLLGAARWECRCDVCGRTHVFNGHALRWNTPVKKCRDRIRRDEQRVANKTARAELGLPALTNRIKDLTGQTFEHLTVLGRSDQVKKAPGAYWRCACSRCGGEHVVRSWDLRHKTPKCRKRWWQPQAAE